MNAPGVASRAARATTNAPGSLGGNPVLDAQGEVLAQSMRTRVVPPAAPRSTPFAVNDVQLGTATQPGALLTPPKAVTAEFLDPKLTAPEAAPKGTVAKLRAAPGALMDGVKNIRVPEGFNLGSPSQVAAQKLAVRGLGAVALAPDVIKGLQVANAPGHTDVDALAQGSETVGKFGVAAAGAGIGAQIGGALGAPFAGVGAIPGAAIGGVVGGGAGYMFGDGAIKTLRGAYDRFANGTPWNQVDTRSPHERLVTPAATSKEAPAQASYSNEGRNHPTKVVTPEPPKTVRGMNGRTYLDGAVTGDDHTRAETLINGAFGNRGKSGLPGEENMNMLRNNAASMDMYNQGLAAKGSGIQVSKDANGQLRLSSSTAPEKMQYTTPDGTPTSDYSQTRQYAEGVGVAKRDRALADKMEHDRLVQEAGSNNAAYALPAQRRLAQEQVTNNQAIEKDKTQALREGHQLEYEGRMAPTRLAQANQKLIQQVMGHQAIGGDLMKGSRYLNSIGRGDLAKTMLEQLASEQSAATATENLGASQAKNMRDQFKGQFAHLPKEEAEYAEALASQTLDKLNSGEIVGAGKNHDMKQQAILHTKALLGMQQKAKLRNSGAWNWVTGEDGRPTAIRGSASPEEVSSLRGAFTGHNLVAGDYRYGDQELPADVGEDVISYLRQYNAAHTAAANKKAK